MQVFNPYLPEWEYIPDGEPYVFGGRVYPNAADLSVYLRKQHQIYRNRHRAGTY